MAVDPHIELIAALKNYKVALDRVSAAARSAAASAEQPDAWPTDALSTWWKLVSLTSAGARKALVAWRAWQGLDVAGSITLLREQGRLQGVDDSEWMAWEDGTGTPTPTQVRDLEAVTGIPAVAWVVV